MEDEYRGFFELVQYKIIHGIGVIPTASVGIKNGLDSEVIREAATGGTPREASFNAIMRVLNVRGRDVEWAYSKVSDEVWRVVVVVIYDSDDIEFTAVGRAESSDLFRAETEACVDAAGAYKKHCRLNALSAAAPL